MTPTNNIPRHFLHWLIIAFVLVVGCYLAYASYRYYNPNVNFQEYVPTELPAGISVGAKTVEFWSSPMLPLQPIKTNVRVSLGEHASLLEEQYSLNLSANTCTPVVNQKCIEARTSKGQFYRTVTTYVQSDSTNNNYDKLSTIVATFDRDGTRILINFDQSASQLPIDWGGFIDSFVPTTFSQPKVVHMQPGP